MLHNLACCYQRLGSLEDCVSYLDGTIYNIDSKITDFDEACAEMILMSERDEDAEQPLATDVTQKLSISSKFQKLRYLSRLHL